MATPAICSIPDCGNKAHSRGWCNHHYRRWHTHGDPTKVTVFPITLDFKGRYPTQAELALLLDYNPETGRFLWLPRTANSPLNDAWNKRFAGKQAGKPRKHYSAITLGNKTFLAHRLALIISCGDEYCRDRQVDHANGDITDNRISNLRLASHSQNQANQKLKKKPRWPGMPKGVAPHKNGRFRAQITVKGHAMYLGYFPTPEAAHRAYMAAAKKYHGKFARAK